MSLKRSDPENLAKLAQFMSARKKFRDKLATLGMPEPGIRMNQKVRELLIATVFELVTIKFDGDECVYGAAVALDGVDPGIRGLPKDHPMLWAMAALLGSKREDFFNLNYMRRLANALANAETKGVDQSDLADYLSSKKRNESYRVPRTPSPHKRVSQAKARKSGKRKLTKGLS